MIAKHTLLCLFLSIVGLGLFGCKETKLRIVSVQDFSEFVKETNYITDAEQYGWSIVQKNVFEYEVVSDINWTNAYDASTVSDDLPVVQVSYNDAKAYADWNQSEIPDYKKYWELAPKANGLINKNSATILPISQCQVIGNVWEITAPDLDGKIRLAGGSFLCNDNSCNGTSSSRMLYIDAITGNSHIGFAVLESQ
ncbi:MAG: hypothetical protein ACJA1A_002102 [Saprospiraceae bacterium]|jgi:hypothetical protein